VCENRDCIAFYKKKTEKIRNCRVKACEVENKWLLLLFAYNKNICVLPFHHSN
jgi:hypothetical protein